MPTTAGVIIGDDLHPPAAGRSNAQWLALIIIHSQSPLFTWTVPDALGSANRHAEGVA